MKGCELLYSSERVETHPGTVESSRGNLPKIYVPPSAQTHWGDRVLWRIKVWGRFRRRCGLTSRSVVMRTLLDPERNSLMIRSRSFWSMSPC